MGNGNDAPVTVAVALGALNRPGGNALAKRPGVFVGGSRQQFVDAIVPVTRKPVRAGGAQEHETALRQARKRDIRADPNELRDSTIKLLLQCRLRKCG